MILKSFKTVKLGNNINPCVHLAFCFIDYDYLINVFVAVFRGCN